MTNIDTHELSWYNYLVEIMLTQGKAALIDSVDAHLAKHVWTYNDTRGDGNGYAIRNTYIDGKVKRLYMHRVVAEAQGDELVRHRNGNHLDNRRANLVKITQSQRAAYAKPTPNKCGYRGVSEDARGDYRAYIRVDGRLHHLGTFCEPVAAARAYDSAALSALGEFAILNFPDAVEPRALREVIYDSKRLRKRELFEQGRFTSPYIGVCRRSPTTYRAAIYFQGKQLYLGTFSSDKAAACAYDAAARRYFGSSALVNFPEEPHADDNTETGR